MKQYFILIVLLIAGCNLSAQQNLPQVRPADFKLTYHFDGGMSYHFEDIIISKDSCVYRLNERGHIITRKFFISEAGLDSLYTILKQNRFTEIEYRNEGMVYDRGGKSIEVSWNNNKEWRKVSDAQSHFVKDGWKQQWLLICRYVINLPYSSLVSKKQY
ncbi:MAG: hypothetical protein JNM14_00350 [Ferruginibacter sp.]|nr:hypothetical protein [Ferruginibacter sp.]